MFPKAESRRSGEHLTLGRVATVVRLRGVEAKALEPVRGREPLALGKSRARQPGATSFKTLGFVFPIKCP